MPTNESVIYFFIKRWSDSKIFKIEFSILKVKIRIPIKYSESKGRAHQLWPEQLLRGFQYSYIFALTPQQNWQGPPPTTVNFFLCFVDGNVTINLCDCLPEVPVDALTQVYNNAHISYIHIHTYSHTHNQELTWSFAYSIL